MNPRIQAYFQDRISLKQEQAPPVAGFFVSPAFVRTFRFSTMKMNQREFMNKYRFEVIGGTLVYCVTNQMIHGHTIGWQGVAAAVVFVIIVSFYKGTITIK